MKDKILKEFDEQFVNEKMLEIRGKDRDTYVFFMGQKIKSFISSSIDQIITEIEDKVIEYNDTRHNQDANETTDDILSILKKYKE